MPEPGSSPPVTAKHIGRGLAWVSFGSAMIGVLDLAAQMILLHFFLSPAEYGVAALVTTLFPILDQATDMGLSSAVIQRDDHSPENIATVFWLNCMLSAVLFVGLAIGAPLYARWQGYPVVGPMLLAYGGKLLFQNAYAIPFAMMRRELRWKELSIIKIVANVVEFAAKVGFGAAGFGAWCFVLAALLRNLCFGIAVQLRHPWRPRLLFRPRAASAYARFGITTSASQLLYYFYTSADYPVVSKLFGATALGLYRAAYELVLELVRTISNVFIDLGFPTFARLRGDRDKLVEQLIGFTRQALVAILPVVVVVFFAAPETLTVAWGPAFAPASTIARILCAVAVLRALSQVVPPLLDGIGKPSLSLVYHVVATVALPALFVVIGFALGPRLGASSVAVAWAVGYPIAFTALLWLALRELELPALTYLRRVVGVPLCALGATPAALAAHLATDGWAALPRLLAVAAATLGATGLLLWRFQGISLRAIWRALRSD